ncbi:SET and MYND domain-containing protein 4-like isoform X2 [Anopheles stephensi]|uniref:SET and MYND domain-containing protein 4-like isoform X2 n=1 Tax=Anopheles stephensi TaxID=30069 RepID=UPI001658B0E9|nr:SET and MYND domain-containing protein 4-like isoform X2 [Anopheles stephensi]
MNPSLNVVRHNVDSLFDSLWEAALKTRVAQAFRSNLHWEDLMTVLKHETGMLIRTVPYREMLQLREDRKDPVKASWMRNKGNEMVRRGVEHFIEAIHKYNESITYSEQGSEERALAYANRSIVCLQLRRYEDCLTNIRLARESNYPERMAEKLAKRELKARQMLQQPNHVAAELTEQEQEQLVLSYPAHENMAQVANCLQLQRNAKYGRHVVTNRPLTVGDVVMIDAPFVKLLGDGFRYVLCAYCNRETPCTLIPCEGCSLAMYCSEECLSKAHQQYHRYECGIIRELWRISGSGPVITLRTVALTIAAFDYDLLALGEHLASLDESSVNLFAMDWKSATPKDNVSAVHVLSTNQQHRRRKDQAYHVFVATLLHDLALQRTELGSICGTNLEKRRLLLDLFVRYMQIMQCNTQELASLAYNMPVPWYNSVGYGTGCYPLISMLNHSCAPNVTRITLPDGRCAIVVVRPIAAGGQLFDFYEIHHLHQDREERQTSLQTMYHFRCDCEACLNDYPGPEYLQEGDIFVSNILTEYFMHQESIFRDPKKAKQMMAKLQALLKRIAGKYPDFEACECQQEFVRCLQRVYSCTLTTTKYKMDGNR